MQRQLPALAVYVHWPFCRSKCPYCDFNSHVREAVDQRRWRAALLRELDHWAERVPGRTVTSLFFGGGTPSLMEPETVAAVIARVGARWTMAADVEITLEANPTSVEAARFAALADAGVNRVSLGVQALDDAALRFLGRQHAAREALDAVALAHRHFARSSFDLIYARPGQTAAQWRAELAAALSHAGEHLSVYQLTIEPQTAFEGAYRRGAFALPDEDTAVALFEATQELMERAGRPLYEISNHARPGAECRHNLAYWRYADYVGIGPGAHGRPRIGGAKFAARQHRAPEAWLERVERQGHATTACDALQPAAQAEEALMMGMRLAEGIDAARFRAATGVALDDALDPQGLAAMIEGGFVERTAGGIRATREGLVRLDAVLARLAA
ncbi:MAG: coproporphyrinogen III oxidase [Alphaproteobacteria bacterium]|nr:coproporphyrinogen III oxidase [Alphaproteobacteria bacterium]